MQALGFPQGGTQWVDSPVTAAAPAAQPGPQQDMVFQWVDSPNYRTQQPPQPQQPYLHAPPAPPYGYQGGMDRHLDPSLLGHVGQPGLPPQGFDPYGGGGGRAPPAYGQRQPYMDDPYAQAAYGQQGYQLFEQPGARGYQAQGGGFRGGPVAGGVRSQRPLAPSHLQNRPPPAGGGRHGPDTRGGGGGAIRGAEMTAEAQLAGVLDSMGKEGVRMALVSALESLYEDRIKPMANYVKGRLKERALPEPLVKNFVELYMQHSDLFVVQQPPIDAQADEVTIFFVTEPTWFKGWVDIDAPDDPYDEATWSELAKFLDGEHSFAGGRYGMARELMQRNLPFLSHLKLGEVCHMVQLAIQHRRLIVYHRKMLKPIQTVLCPSSAPAPTSPSGGGGAAVAAAEGDEIADMDDLCMVLFRMLIHHPQGIRLCRMKQMIKHEFSRKLSEMAFQCTKLIELFNQEPLAATFILDTENDGKSIYVRLGNPETFSEHVGQIYTRATSAEAAQVRQVLRG